MKKKADTFEFDMGIQIPEDIVPEIGESMAQQGIIFKHPGIQDYVTSIITEIMKILGPTAEEVSGGGGFGFRDAQIRVPNLTEDTAFALEEKIRGYLNSLGMIEQRSAASTEGNYYLGAWNVDDPEQYMEGPDDEEGLAAFNNRYSNNTNAVRLNMKKKAQDNSEDEIVDPDDQLKKEIEEYMAHPPWGLFTTTKDFISRVQADLRQGKHIQQLPNWPEDEAREQYVDLQLEALEEAVYYALKSLSTAYVQAEMMGIDPATIPKSFEEFEAAFYPPGGPKEICAEVLRGAFGPENFDWSTFKPANKLNLRKKAGAYLSPEGRYIYEELEHQELTDVITGDPDLYAVLTYVKGNPSITLEDILSDVEAFSDDPESEKAAITDAWNRAITEGCIWYEGLTEKITNKLNMKKSAV